MPSPAPPPECLFESCRPRLAALALQMLGNAEDAEELVQDCFLKWHAAAQAELPDPALWLATIVRKLAIERLRQRSRAARHRPDPPQAPPTPEEALEAAEATAHALALLLRRLTAAERRALVLREVFACDHQDIAAALGVTPNHSRQLLYRARLRIVAGDGARAAPPPPGRTRTDAFVTALRHLDQPAMLALLGDPQPVSDAMCVQYRQIRGHIARMTALCPRSVRPAQATQASKV